MTRRLARGVALTLVIARPASADEPIEVEVRGQPIAAPPKEPSVAGSVIREERLHAPGLQAGDVLRTQPGVAVLDTGGYGSLSTASLRGATAGQTPVYLAGVRLNDDVGGAADLSFVPLWMVHRVEIYRSHAPLAGDRLGIGGAIFFEPRRPKTTEAGAGALAGSFGAHALWARGGLGDDSVTGLIGVRLDGARNDYTFVNDGGTRFDPTRSRTVTNINADTRTMDVWATGSLFSGAQGRVDLVANDVEREQGLPGLTLFPSTRARLAQSRRLAGITTRMSNQGDTFEVIAMTAAILAHASYDDPLREAGLGTTKLDLDASRIEHAVLIRWSLSDHWSISPTVLASIERMAIDASGLGPVHAQRLFSRAAVQTEWILSDVVTLRALGSAECDGTLLNGVSPLAQPGDATGPTQGSNACNQFQPAVRAGAQMGHAPLTFLVNIGRYGRVPTLTELYGLSGAVRGNTALVPETGLSVEAGVRATASQTTAFRGTSADLFAFVRWASDLVAYQRSSIGYVRPFNVGSARVAGLELLASYRPVSFALFELAATLLDPRNTAPVRPVNDILPYQPRLTLVPRFEFGSKVALRPIDSGKLSLSYFYESSRYADPAGLVSMPEQGSLDAETEVGAFESHVMLRGRLTNLLDQTRFDLIGYPLPGRAAYVALEARW